MPRIRASIGANGPIVSGLLASPSADKKIPIRALIDSGCTHTMASQAVIQQLGLVSVGTTDVAAPAFAEGLVRCRAYGARLFLGDNPADPSFSLSVLEWGIGRFRRDFDLLLGRDVLAHCHLSYHGHGQTFCLSWDKRKNSEGFEDLLARAGDPALREALSELVARAHPSVVHRALDGLLADVHGDET